MSLTIPPPLPMPSSLLPGEYAYIVAYRLNGPPEAYKDLFQELRDFEDWFNYTPNLWIVVTRKAMVDVMFSLRSKIRTTDWLIVMPAKGPADGWLPAEGWNWLNKHLRREW